MNLSYFRELIAYHYWARDRMLDAVDALTAEQYARMLGGSFGSVRDTLNHAYGAEVLWLQRWRGTSPTGFPADMPQSLAELRHAWQVQEASMRQFVLALAEPDLQRVIAYRNLAGVPGESTLWEMLAHVVNHATYHRGQVTTLLRLLDVPPPPSTDLIAYYRGRDRSASSMDQVPSLRIRPVTRHDAPTIARLHATSWRTAYRGILTDAYLDDDLEGERLTVWTAKLSAPDAGPGWLALVNDTAVGFVYVRPREDAHWGTLVDNLHVLPGHQGLGIGRRLLHTVGDWASTHAPDARVHLWVFADNAPARGFYARVAGSEVEFVDRDASDGRKLPEYRVAWDSPAALISGTSR